MFAVAVVVVVVSLFQKFGKIDLNSFLYMTISNSFPLFM